jgi:NADPH:quinone reductase-like Zn-dependent oxidoreductase
VAAGIVDAVGNDVTGFAVGDAVSVIPAVSMNQYPPTARSFLTRLCRREAPGIAVVRRGRVDLDDVSNSLRRTHRRCQGDQG